jgi:hypothetical protein
MDMQTLYKLRLKYQFLVVGLISFFLVSCGSHGDNSYSDTDGIYNTSNGSAPSQEVSSSEKDTYYKAYFKSKEDTYSEMPQEDLIFTDIEAYSTTESLDEEGFIVVDEYEEAGYAGWGQNGGEVSVNFYAGVGYYGGYWGIGYAWWNPFWFYGGYWGIGNPYWGIGYAWWNPICYYGGYYGGNNGSVGYNRGRRNSDYYNGRSTSPGRLAQSSSRNSYSRSEQYRSNNGGRAYRSSATGHSYSRTRGYTGRSYNSQRSYRGQGTSSRSRNNVGRSNSRYRSSNNSRSNTQRSRSSVGRSSSYRSSGSSRSSGGGSRSSGSRGGGGRGGRG